MFLVYRTNIGKTGKANVFCIMDAITERKWKEKTKEIKYEFENVDAKYEKIFFEL